MRDSIAAHYTRVTAEKEALVDVEINCGPLPKTPPGVVGNEPRFGRSVKR